MAPYRALLDACVLVPVSLADTMLRVAEKGLYRPLWSDRILTEALDAIAEVFPILTRMDHDLEGALSARRRRQEA